MRTKTILIKKGDKIESDTRKKNLKKNTKCQINLRFCHVYGNINEWEDPQKSEICLENKSSD